MQALVYKFKSECRSLFSILIKANQSGLHTASGRRLLRLARKKIQKQLEFELPKLLNHTTERSGDFASVIRMMEKDLGKLNKSLEKYDKSTFLFSIQGRLSSNEFTQLIYKYRRKITLEEHILRQKTLPPQHTLSDYLQRNHQKNI